MLERRSIESHLETMFPQEKESETSKEETRPLLEKARQVIEKIFQWAENQHIQIAEIRKLGGGFVNLVLLIESDKGENFVVKAFENQAGADTTREAQSTLSHVAEGDEQFTPRIVEWIDESTVISERAEGTSLRSLLEKIDQGPEGKERMINALQKLGRTLGSLHERTKTVRSPDVQNQEDRLDAAKLIRNLGQNVEAGLIPMTSESLKELQEKIVRFTKSGEVSVIHADAHLDQFFYTPDRSLVTIVDYDTVQNGDPNADIARTLASLRDWSRQLDVPENFVRECERNFFLGYRETRRENLSSKESDFNQKKILVYEMRLCLIQLRVNDKIRRRLEAVVPEGSTLFKLLLECHTDPIIREKLAVSLKLSGKERDAFSTFMAAHQTLVEILDYVQKIKD